jgi:pimeloyl-ACP methyl ester carboxylesterase
MVAALLGLMLLGALYESFAEAADRRAYPPPGRLVDVGGYRLHINCVGTGGPTVVIEAGAGDWSATWSSWVQPGVAGTTRVCTYDRAGLGWSDPGPLPRTAGQFALELHTLLQRAGIPGPYVLVGHSLGGLTVRLFAHAYPADVAGVVLVDAMHPDQATHAAPTTPPQAPARASDLSIATLPARVGVLRLLAWPLGFKSGLSPAVADAFVAYSVTPRNLQTTLDESAGIGASLAQASAVASLGDLPLIVVSRGAGHDEDWRRMQVDLLRLSSDSEHLIAEQSGHNVQLDQPETAVEAIATMVERLRHEAAR